MTRGTKEMQVMPKWNRRVYVSCATVTRLLLHRMIQMNEFITNASPINYLFLVWEKGGGTHKLTHLRLSIFAPPPKKKLDAGSGEKMMRF